LISCWVFITPWCGIGFFKKKEVVAANNAMGIVEGLVVPEGVAFFIQENHQKEHVERQLGALAYLQTIS
jgi:hypothetical protein